MLTHETMAFSMYNNEKARTKWASFRKWHKSANSHLFAIFARLRKAKRRKDDELVMINQWKKEEPLWNKEKMPIYFWPFHYYTWKTPLFRVSTYDVFSFNAHFDLLYFRTYVKIQAFHWFRHSTLTHGKR
jgi:hypothetical protein